MKDNFIEITGFIRSVQYFKEDLLLEIWDGKDEEHITNLIINQYTILTTLTGEPLEISDHLKGCYMTAFVNGRKPVMAIYPPRFYPELVAIRKDEQFGIIQIGVFNEDLVSEKLSLKLNVSDETEITDCFGNPLSEEDIKNNYSFVYYTRSTRSIPAQAPVKKVIVYVDPFGEMQDRAQK